MFKIKVPKKRYMLCSGVTVGTQNLAVKLKKRLVNQNNNGI